MTVGELKALLKDVDDNIPVIVHKTDRTGYSDEYVSVKLKKLNRYSEIHSRALTGTEYEVQIISPFVYDDTYNIRKIDSFHGLVIE